VNTLPKGETAKGKQLRNYEKNKRTVDETICKGTFPDPRQELIGFARLDDWMMCGGDQAAERGKD
jgi:hypothetical protein